MAIKYALSKKEINPEDLKYKYYVQLTPDRTHLATGMLQQENQKGNPPKEGNWLQVGKIDRNFTARYFVQYTKFNTLVPGSLVQGTRFPKGLWKEVKKSTSTFFSKVVFTQPDTYEANQSFGLNSLTDYAEFKNNKMLPALNLVFPNRNFNAPISIRLFFFLGNYNELDKDPTKLHLFSTNTFALALYRSGNYESYITLNSNYPNTELRTSGGAPAGTYSIVLGVLNNNSEVENYVVMENIFTIISS